MWNAWMDFVVSGTSKAGFPAPWRKVLRTMSLQYSTGLLSKISHLQGKAEGISELMCGIKQNMMMTEIVQRISALEAQTAEI